MGELVPGAPDLDQGATSVNGDEHVSAHQDQVLTLPGRAVMVFTSKLEVLLLLGTN